MSRDSRRHRIPLTAFPNVQPLNRTLQYIRTYSYGCSCLPLFTHSLRSDTWLRTPVVSVESIEKASSIDARRKEKFFSGVDDRFSVFCEPLAPPPVLGVLRELYNARGSRRWAMGSVAPLAFPSLSIPPRISSAYFACLAYGSFATRTNHRRSCDDFVSHGNTTRQRTACLRNLPVTCPRDSQKSMTDSYVWTCTTVVSSYSDSKCVWGGSFKLFQGVEYIYSV